MADVASIAGLVRQTVYNTVSGRDKLVELAILQCCEELTTRLAVEVGSSRGSWKMPSRASWRGRWSGGR